ncbi:hypothetical protein Q3G72_033408 [Acer saccharum]|nr:hypothetical protein Q3G72_033408 [Acer saccharum]
MYVDKIPSISMEKLHFFFINMFFLVFLLQFTFLTADTPSKNYLFINCGSKSTITVDDRSFVGDVIINSGHSFAVGKSEPIQEHPNSSSSTDTAPLYQTARVFKQRSSYEFDVTEKGTYMVRLHFYVFTSKKIDLGDAQFNVSASGISLLSNFRILKNTSSLPVIKEFLLTVNVGKFRINFIPTQEKSFAFINAIEVLLTHRNYGLASSDDSPPQVSSKGSNGTYHTLLSWVLQTIQRINIGGSFLDASDDTVLWRNWISDEKNLLPGSSVKNCPATGFPLSFEDKEDALYYAPEPVYLTCRELILNDGQGSNVSSWRFAVNKNARHLVREPGMELGSLPVQGTQNKKRLLIGSIGGLAIVFISIMGFFWGRKCWKAKQVEKIIVSQAMPSYEDAYTLPDKYFINCGGRTSSQVPDSNQVAGQAPTTIYQTARVFRQTSRYEFQITNTSTTYLVRLHFFAFPSTINLSTAVFDVSTSEFSLLPNFTFRNSTNAPTTKQFLFNITSGKFDIYFVPQVSSFAFVNAIEVFPAPESFIPDTALHITSSGTYTLPDKYFINCGSETDINSVNRVFTGDLNSGSVTFTKKDSSQVLDSNQVAGQAPTTIYQTARVFRQPSRYEFQITNTSTTYLVRLHFFAFPSTINLSTAVFDVSTSEFSLLRNFTFRNTTNAPTTKEFLFNITSGKFDIYFVPQVSSFAFVNAIEVFPAPESFIPDTALHITSSGKTDMGEEAVMSEFKHLVIVKFKEGVVVEDIIKGMEKLVSEIDVVKSFEWLMLH